MQNLYVASELAQHLIKGRAKAHSWALESYPGKLKLPGDILRSLPNPEAAREVPDLPWSYHPFTEIVLGFQNRLSSG